MLLPIHQFYFQRNWLISFKDKVQSKKMAISVILQVGQSFSEDGAVEKLEDQQIIPAHLQGSSKLYANPRNTC